MKNIIVIPARLESTRLPNKVLLDLNGKSIIHRVHDQCLKVKNIDAVYIATDNDIIIEHCKLFSHNIIKTKNTHSTGTDRVAEAISKIECDNVINIQADEPFIKVSLIEDLVLQFMESDVCMVSAMHKIKTLEELSNPNNVKVCVDKKMNAMYFSRSPIPYQRDSLLIGFDSINYYKHIGIYGYTKEFLSRYSKMDITEIEIIEKLEQLRVLENGYTIRMVLTDEQTLGIDTLEDYKEAQKSLTNIN